MQAQKPLANPTKQRKMVYGAPDHVRHRLLAGHLSRSLRDSHGVRSLAVRTGDTVRVMRGDHRGVEGKITRVDLTKYRVYVEGLTREKVDGTTVFIPIHPSKVVVTHLNLEDKWRKKILETKKERRSKLEKVVEKPEAKTLEKPKEVAQAEEIIEEKPAPKEKARRKRVAEAKRKALPKSTSEKARLEAKEVQKKERPRPKRKVRQTSHETVKKTEEEGIEHG
jgi:large subunit ribosomal protein L24